MIVLMMAKIAVVECEILNIEQTASKKIANGKSGNWLIYSVNKKVH